MSYLALNLLVALAALIFERLVGYPNWLYRAINHPVVWMGALISILDRFLNRDNLLTDSRRRKGIFSLFILVFLVFIIALPISLFLRSFVGGLLIEAVLASSMLAQKSLRDFVEAVGRSLGESIEKGRTAVSHIVGRDPSQLDESEVAKAGVESLAENTADGVIAPLFWMMLFGLPGAAVYKAINTADSMVGYRSEKYLDFGWASAKLDDLVNYPASRLCGLLFVATAFLRQKWRGKEAYQVMMRDAGNHLSPNAGWPEAAMAGALGLTLGGPRSYEGRAVELATMGHGRDYLTKTDIKIAIEFFRWSMTLAAIILAVITLVVLVLV
ncbi:MAG: adenosylcobinamide-phosphate synthase CbiB [Hyphomicrobiales bacterium]